MNSHTLELGSVLFSLYGQTWSATSRRWSTLWPEEVLHSRIKPAMMHPLQCCTPEICSAFLAQLSPVQQEGPKIPATWQCPSPHIRGNSPRQRNPRDVRSKRSPCLLQATTHGLWSGAMGATQSACRQIWRADTQSVVTHSRTFHSARVASRFSVWKCGASRTPFPSLTVFPQCEIKLQTCLYENHISMTLLKRV